MSKVEHSMVANSIKATVVVGVNAGYNHQNEVGVDLVEFGEVYKTIADTIMNGTGIYISTVVTPCKVLYRTEWGCPIGGEVAVRLEADCNPMYSELPASEYINVWKQAFMEVVELLMEELGQSAATVTFSSGEVVYFQRSK